MRFRAAVLFFVFWAVWVPGVARAVVLPPDFILKSLAKKHGGFKLVKLKTRVVGDRGKFTVHTQVDYGTGIVTAEAFEGETDGGPVVYRKSAPLSRHSSLGVQILLSDDAAKILPGLRARELPVEARESKLSLARYQGKIAWVMGAPKGKVSPQLWIEKDVFLPMRWVEGTNDWEFGEMKFVKEFPYPKKSVYSRVNGGKLEALWSEEQLDTVVNPAPPKKGAPVAQPVEGSGFTDAASSLSGDAKAMIEEYFTVAR